MTNSPSELSLYYFSGDVIENTVSNSVFDCCGSHCLAMDRYCYVFTQPLPHSGPCNHVTIRSRFYRNVVRLFASCRIFKLWRNYESCIETNKVRFFKICHFSSDLKCWLNTTIWRSTSRFVATYILMVFRAFTSSKEHLSYLVCLPIRMNWTLCVYTDFHLLVINLFVNIVFQHPIALIFTYTHIYFHLKFNFIIIISFSPLLCCMFQPYQAIVRQLLILLKLLHCIFTVFKMNYFLS